MAGSPSPLQALSQNLDMDKILSAAVSAEIKNIVSFTDLRGFVKDELMNSGNFSRSAVINARNYHLLF